MDAKKIKSIKNDILKNLSIVLSNNDLIEQISSNKDFLKIILNHLSMLKQIEGLSKSKGNEFKNIFDKLNKIVPTKESEIKPTSFNEESDFRDEINYLYVFVKNSYNVDLSSIDSSSNIKQDKNNNFKKEQDQPKTEGLKQSSQNASSYDYAKDTEIIKSQMVNSMIAKRMQEDYAKGNYYFYLTKPKIVPILRYLSGIFTILSSIAIIVSFILQIVVSNKNLIVGFYNDKPVKFNWLDTTNMFQIILYISLIALLISFALRNFKKISNDNYKYVLSPIFFYASGLFGVSILITPCINLSNVSLLYNDGFNNSASAIACFIAMQAVSICASLFLIGLVPIALVYRVYKPKENEELKLMLMEKYRKEIEDSGLLK